MNILVTGGTGFLGKKVAVRLQELGHDVTILGRNAQAGKEMSERGIQFRKVDFSQRERIVESCAGMDYVFHCGAYSSPWGVYEDFYAVNTLGTKWVIEGCKTHHVKRMIHVSTPSIYFSFDERLDVKESDPLPQKFVNHYAFTKFLAEKEVDKAWKEGLAVITIRPRAIFGPGDNAILPRLIEANQQKFIPSIRGAKVQMDLTYVENVVDALLLCMDSPETTLGQKYNITNGETVVLHEVLGVLFKKIGMPFRTKVVSWQLAFGFASFLEWFARVFQKNREPFLTKYTVSVLSKSQTLNIDKARTELGYQPRISIEKGIEAFGKWWCEEQKRKEKERE